MDFMHDTDPTLYLLCGIPYAGKSTFADTDPVLAPLPKLSTDRLILDKAKRMGTTYAQIFQDAFREADKTFREEVKAHFKEGTSFVIDRTSGTPGVRKRFLKKAKKHGFKVVCLYFEPPPDAELKRRMALRAEQGLSWERVLAFKAGFVVPTADEGFDACFVVNQQGIRDW